MTHQEVEILVRAMTKLWPTVPFQAAVDADLIRLWQLVLIDVPLSGAELVLVTRARAGDRFPPTPGDIVRWHHWMLDRTPDVDEAWTEVRRAVSRVGWHAGPPTDWSHPAVRAAATAIGWTELCHGEEMVVRAHFFRLYPTVQTRVEHQATAARTMGALGIDTSGVVKSLTAGDPDDDRRSL